MSHDCLRSFQIRIAQATVCQSGSGFIKTWGTVGQYFFSLNLTPNNQGSTYNLTGFKSTDIYGVSVNGYVHGNFTSSTQCAVISDWSFNLNLNGNAPLVSGDETVSPNGFDIITSGSDLNTISLSKYSNTIMFANPYQSVQSINFSSLLAQGSGAQFLNAIDLVYNLSFTFYYKYEGEE